MDVIERLRQAKTEAELDELEREIGGANIVETVSAVAGWWDCHERTVSTWLAEGCPGEEGFYDLREIAKWRLLKAERRHGGDDQSERELRRDERRLIIERRQLDLDERKGLLIRKDEAVADITEVFATMKTRAEAWPAETASSFPPELRDSLLVDLKAKVRSFLKELEAVGQ